MRKYTKDQYIEMSKKFNKLSFIDKIKIIKDNTDIFQLGADYNWWRVKLIDEEMQQILDDEEICFLIEKEWDHNEMSSLLHLLGIKITDHD